MSSSAKPDQTASARPAGCDRGSSSPPAVERRLKIDAFVRSRVARYYWRDDVNCATAALNILAEHFDFPLSEQVIDAAVGMHGAGEYGAQCGLVEGALMFLGIMGRSQGVPDPAIVSACRAFAEGFEKRFRSLSCAVLRPQGFTPGNPPHLCENLTCAAIGFSIDSVQGAFKSAGARRSPGQARDCSESHPHQHARPPSGNPTAPRT